VPTDLRTIAREALAPRGGAGETLRSAASSALLSRHIDN
jgi:hypothetical protein